MAIRTNTLIMACLLACPSLIQAQTKDTIVITPAQVNTGVLREGTHRYLVYFKMNKNATRTNTQFWTRTIERTTYQDKPAIRINQVWEDKDSIVHTVSSVCDAKTLQPLYHESWWKQRGDGSFDFTKRAAAMNGQPLNDQDTAKRRKMAWDAFKQSWDKYVLNWHLDLEVFPVLPYREGVTFLIPYYDPGATAPENVAYTVTGSAVLKGYNDQEIDCWLLRHETNNNKELFWISKQTHEVLKLEQEVNGTIYRYKIKLGFSM